MKRKRKARGKKQPNSKQSRRKVRSMTMSEKLIWQWRKDAELWQVIVTFRTA
jgi:hypothetical protein